MSEHYRQGDVLLIPIAKIPTNAKSVKHENGRLIIAKQAGVELVTAEQATELRMWLTITTGEPVALTHQEHATIMLPPGQYERRIQREYSPEQIRNVAD